MKPNQRPTVYTLLERNTSGREIARITGIDRKTVRSYRTRWLADISNSPGVATGSDLASNADGAVSAQIPPPWPPAPVSVLTSLCEVHREFIEAQLRLRRNATAIYQDLVDAHGFTGAYNSVKRFVRALRHKAPEQFDRLCFLPGEEMQVDYGEGAPTRVPGTDRYKKPRLFVATLRHSRRSFRRVLWKSSQQVWAQLHEQAFRYFGGCTQYVVLDNLKEGVLKPDLYEPELNPVYAATLSHYGAVADPARVRDPNRTGTVEHAIGHTQATALKGKRFETLEAQNDFLEHWETNWAAKRIHGTERCQVQAMFEAERAHLKPLPLLGMQYFSEAARIVCDDSCIDGACAQALTQGVYSYKHVKALAERLFADAMAAMDEAASMDIQAHPDTAMLRPHLAQQHELIRQADEYADLFTHAAMAASAAVSKAKMAPNAQGGEA